MSAIKKEDLARLEKEYGLEPDGLSYQHRCSRIAAYQAGQGESWTPPEKEARQDTSRSSFRLHPLYGKTILLSPRMTADKNRMLYYDEELGPEMETQDVNAGERIYNMDDTTQRLMTDYEITRVSKTRKVIAKSHVPKINTELTYTIGKDLAVVCRGESQRGYLWSYPVQDIQIGDTIVRIWGLQSLIREVFPELEREFHDPPLMTYIDGVSLAANIPMTHDIIARARRQRLIDERAGIERTDFLV